MENKVKSDIKEVPVTNENLSEYTNEIVEEKVVEEEVVREYNEVNTMM